MRLFALLHNVPESLHRIRIRRSQNAAGKAQLH